MFDFGTTFLAIKVGVDAGVPPFLSAGLRFSLPVYYYLVLWLGAKNDNPVIISKRNVFYRSGLNLGTFATLYWAEQYVTSGIASVLSATGPMMIIVIQTFILKKRRPKIIYWLCCRSHWCYVLNLT